MSRPSFFIEVEELYRAFRNQPFTSKDAMEVLHRSQRGVGGFLVSMRREKLIAATDGRRQFDKTRGPAVWVLTDRAIGYAERATGVSA